MKKLLTLVLALVMILSLAACGGGNNTPDPSGSGDNTPSSSEQQEQQPSDEPDDSTPSGDGLSDISDSEIVMNANLDISIVPDVLKKGIGTLNSSGLRFSLPSSELQGVYSAAFNVVFIETSEDAFNALLDYYEENGGTAEDVFGTSHVTFEWGELDMRYFSSNQQVVVSGFVK